MTDKKTRERPLGLDMDPDEALARFLQTDPLDIPDNKKLDTKKPPPKRGPVVAKKSVKEAD